jgi:hypothetical protein
MVGSGVRVSPAASASTVNSERPSSPAEPGRRAATTIRPAVCPSRTNIFVPDSRKPLSPGVASMVMPPASHFPAGSVKARVAIVSPEAMPGRRADFCSSVPALRMALAARHTDEK